MKIIIKIWISLFFSLLLTTQSIAQFQPGNYSDESQKIIKTLLQDSEGFERLTTFVDAYPHRLSGSEGLENAIDWIVQKMREDNELSNIRTQEVMVPHWVRGDESATLITPYTKELPMLGLGGSVATPENGIKAEVLIVNSFKDLEEKSDQAKDKIVLYNVPFTSYGETVQYRMNGAVEAARHGAVASLIRTVGSYSMQTPHTGTSRYEEGIKKIPHAAITIEDAKLIQRMANRGKEIVINLKMDARTLKDAPSRNIIAEIRGTEKPQEIVVIGGHIDAWDVGQGAMDDAGGCFAAWQALRIMKELGLRPKRTIRLVMWTNEENGLRGGTEYKNMVMDNETLANHILAIESDSGVFNPKGFGFTGSDKAFEIIQSVGQLLEPINAGSIKRGGGGADIGPLMQEGIPGMGLRVNSTRYFWYHHSPADTIDKLKESEFNKCAAALAVMSYVVADMDQTLPQ